MDQQNNLKKYSKISSALKYYFLECLYLKGLTIKQTASRLHLNYSTAKVLIRDLTPNQRSLVKRLLRKKETRGKGSKAQNLRCCEYRIVKESDHRNKEAHESQHSSCHTSTGSIQIISRVSHDFFSDQTLCP